MSCNIGHTFGSFGGIALNSCAHIGFRSHAFNRSGMNGELSGSCFLVVAGDFLFHVLLPWCFAFGFFAGGVMKVSSSICRAYGSFGCISMFPWHTLSFRSRAFNLSGINGELSGSCIMVVAGDLLFHVLLPCGYALGFFGSHVVALNLYGIGGEFYWL